MCLCCIVGKVWCCSTVTSSICLLRGHLHGPPLLIAPHEALGGRHLCRFIDFTWVGFLSSRKGAEYSPGPVKMGHLLRGVSVHTGRTLGTGARVLHV